MAPTREDASPPRFINPFTQLRQATAKITSLEAEVYQLRAEKSLQAAQTASLKKEITSLKSANKASFRELIAARQQTAESAAEIESLKTRVANLERERSELGTGGPSFMASNLATIGRQAAEIDLLRGAVRELQMELAARDAGAQLEGAAWREESEERRE